MHRRLVIAAPLALALPGLAAAQEVELELKRGAIEPVPLAIPAFAGQQGGEFATVISDDLDRSGFFRPLDRTQFLEPVVDGSALPSFSNWKLIGARYLVSGRVAMADGGRLQVEYRLWDVSSEQQLEGLQVGGPAEHWRSIAHKVADSIYERLTGEKGYFDTQIAFVAESGPRTARRKVLGLMDQDGANPQFPAIGSGSAQVFTPRFSSSSQEITYMTLTERSSEIFLYNLDNGRRESLGSFPGMVFAPRFSPDGQRVAFSSTRGGNTDIFIMDLRGRTPVRITTDPGIDTSPSFSPDGQRIVFTSDRAGSPQVYVMSASGAGARRISGGGGQYSTPVWSPRGDYIAFTKYQSRRFSIGIMRPDGSEERLLTSAHLAEGPTWAPNGQVIMFFKEDSPGAEPRLWTIDISGRVLRPVNYRGAASDPAWSPSLN